MDATAVLERLDRLGVSIQLDGPDLILRPGSRVPADVLENVRAHKPEIIAHLRKPRLVNGPPGWHAREIAERVEIEGVCIFWSELVGDVVAFVRDGQQAPAGVVTFDVGELAMLFPKGRPDPDPWVLRMVYETKRLGGGSVIGCEESS